MIRHAVQLTTDQIDAVGKTYRMELENVKTRVILGEYELKQTDAGVRNSDPRGEYPGLGSLAETIPAG